MIADLVPVILTTRMEHRPLTRTEIQYRWLNKPGNRTKFNAYRREWRKRRDPRI